MTTLERHAVELLAARDFDLEPGGEGVDHGDADAVQAAGGLVDLGVEFAAGMQRAHDDFERGFFREFRMRIDRNAAAIVGDGEKSVGAQFHLDEGGVSANASSMELSMTSANRWCRAFSSVPPIYMPGRRRTGSRPSSTSISAAV